MIDVTIFASSENMAGGSDVVSPVGWVVSEFFRDEEAQINELYIVVCTSEKLGELTPEEQDEFGRLPKCIFRKSKKQLEISFLSQTLVASEAFKSGYDIGRINKLAAELMGVMEELRPQINRKLKTDSFAQKCISALSIEVDDLQQIEELEERTGQQRTKEEVVDKSQSHPNAVAIFREDFFWSQGDWFSPHGTDLGSDVLSAYRNELTEIGNQSVKLLNSLIVDYNVIEQNYYRFLLTLGIAVAEIRTHGKIGFVLKNRLFRELESFEIPAQLSESDRSLVSKRLNIIQQRISSCQIVS